MPNEMSDDEFLSYCDTHADTPRCGFVPAQLSRLYALAGDQEMAAQWRVVPNQVINGDYSTIKELVKSARRRQENQPMHDLTLQQSFSRPNGFAPVTYACDSSVGQWGVVLIYKDKADRERTIAALQAANAAEAKQPQQTSSLEARITAIAAYTAELADNVATIASRMTPEQVAMKWQSLEIASWLRNIATPKENPDDV
jgi:hypothetical protein